MKQTKTAWDGEKFIEISDAQMPEFITAYHERQDQRAKVNDRIMFVQVYAFFVIPKTSTSPPRCYPCCEA